MSSVNIIAAKISISPQTTKDFGDNCFVRLNSGCMYSGVIKKSSTGSHDQALLY